MDQLQLHSNDVEHRLCGYVVYRHNSVKSIFINCSPQFIYCTATADNLLQLRKCRFFTHVQVFVQPRKHAIEPIWFMHFIVRIEKERHNSLRKVGGVTHLITFCCKRHHGNRPYPCPYMACKSIEIINIQPTIELWIFFQIYSLSTLLPLHTSYALTHTHTYTNYLISI